MTYGILCIFWPWPDEHCTSLQSRISYLFWATSAGQNNFIRSSLCLKCNIVQRIFHAAVWSEENQLFQLSLVPRSCHFPIVVNAHGIDRHCHSTGRSDELRLCVIARHIKSRCSQGTLSWVAEWGELYLLYLLCLHCLLCLSNRFQWHDLTSVSFVYKTSLYDSKFRTPESPQPSNRPGRKV